MENVGSVGDIDHRVLSILMRTRTIYRALHKLADFVGLRLSPSNWWHYQPFAAASTLSTARAIAELQVAGKADPHLPQSLTIVVDGDAFGRQSIIRADKRI